MSIYNVGDTVRVRTRCIETNNTSYFAADMCKYQGELVTIQNKYLNVSGRQRYGIKEDGRSYVWCNEFFEPYDTSKESYEYW